MQTDPGRPHGRRCGTVVTADFTHHAAREHDAAADRVLVEVSHRAGEWPWLPAVARLLTEAFGGQVESLARRQSTLEDGALELMERREAADAALDAVKAEIVTVAREVDAATVKRNDQWADIDSELGRLAVQRASLTAELPASVLAIYERVRAQGKVAAAPLVGDRCTGCGMSLDRVAFDEIRSAGPDALARCPECGAILIRNPS